MITPFGEIPNSLASNMCLQEQHEWLTGKVSRRTVVKGLLAGAGGMALPFLWSQSATADGSTVVKARHLAYGTDPAKAMVLDFAVDGEFVRARVDATPRGGAGKSADCEVNMVAGSARRYSRATFDGLTPDTEYAYRIILDDEEKSRGTFRTADRGAASFRFTAFGDQGTSIESQQLLKQIAVLSPSFHLVAGDLCYADSSGLGGPGDTFKPVAWDRWLDQNDAVAGNVPWMSVPGNHEMEPGFGMHGYAGYLTRVCPGGTSPLEVPVATTFRVGNVGFVGLDSNDVSYEIPANRGWTNNAQTAWLDRTLGALRSSQSPVDFIVVYFHHGPYSTNNTHASEGGIREAWVPLFDQHSVDLVISGHNHAYERTLPLRGGQVVDRDSSTVDSWQGTTYITAGGGGAAPGSEPVFIPFLNKTRVTTSSGMTVESAEWSVPGKTADHAVLCVDVLASGLFSATPTMVLRAIDLTGREIDRVTLSRPRVEGANLVPWLVGGSAAVALGGGAAITLSRRARHSDLESTEQVSGGHDEKHSE